MTGVNETRSRHQAQGTKEGEQQQGAGASVDAATSPLILWLSKEEPEWHTPGQSREGAT